LSEADGSNTVYAMPTAANMHTQKSEVSAEEGRE